MRVSYPFGHLPHQIITGQSPPPSPGIIERAFGTLKGRFRILLSKMRHKVEFVPAVIMACVCLHNWLKSTGDIWTDEADDEDDVNDDPGSDDEIDEGTGKEAGKAKRELLREHINRQYNAIINAGIVATKKAKKRSLFRRRR